MYFIGIDPDTSTTAIAILHGNEDGTDCRIFFTDIVKHSNHIELKNGLTYIASLFDSQTLYETRFGLVEGQEIYRGVPQRPNDILKLAQYAGVATGVLLMCGFTTTMIRPADWKGQVPKPIQQGRTYTSLGLEYDRRNGYSVPKLLRGHNAGDWKHLGDALGLALFLSKNHHTLFR